MVPSPLESCLFPEGEKKLLERRPRRRPTWVPLEGKMYAGAATQRSVDYIPAAPLLEVLLEQLEYLVSHQEGTCPENCKDCTRLNRIAEYLLVPFARRAAAH